MAFHRDSTADLVLFDSKISEPVRFLSSSDQPNWFEQITGIFSAVFGAISYRLGFSQSLIQ